MSRVRIPLTFRIFQGDELVREATLAQSVIKIGKLSTSHLRLDDNSVSRMHAVVETDGNGEVSIIDLGSTRGTFVNGQKINKATLKSGDRIEIGNTRIDVSMAQAARPAQPVRPMRAANRAASRPAVPAVPAAPQPATASAARTAATSPALPFAGETDAKSGDRAIEVAAMMGDSVVGVRHISNPHTGTVSRITYGLFGLGVAMLITAGVAFAVSVQNADFNKTSKAAWMQENRPVHDWRPRMISPAFDWMALGGLAVGMAALTIGLVRIRNEKQSPFFRIGTDADVEFPTSAAPTSSFPLVAPQGDDFVVNFTADMNGEVAANGQRTSLSDLIAQGHARASQAAAGAFQMAVPSNARIKLTAGKNTFLISAISKPRKHAVPFFRLRENRAMAFFAASAIVHMGLWGMLRTIPPDADTLALEIDGSEVRMSRSDSKPTEDPIQKVDKVEEPTDSAGGKGAAMAGDSGTMGDKTSKRKSGQFKMKDRGPTKQISREKAIAQARESGLLGALNRPHGGPFAALTSTEMFSSGMDDADITGGLLGNEAGAMAGGFGFGKSGFGPGGGGDRWGTIGTGKYATIGHSGGTGRGYEVGGGTGRGRNRVAAVPTVKIGQVVAPEGLDKNTIRRYVRRKLPQIKYCYEKQLLAKPGLSGTVLSKFQITPRGSVLGANASGIDKEVSGCVARVLSTIKFPKPKSTGLLQIHYPFTFRPSGGR